VRIPQETIDLIRDRARIEDVVQRYVPSLKKRGKNFVGLCPFHKEKTPSFTVSPDKQIYRCFGCGEAGNVFTFITSMEKVTFPESVKIVGDYVGISVETTGDVQKNSDFDKLIAINRGAAKLYHEYLFSPEGKVAIKYLEERGVSSDAIEKFKLGYAPDSWQYLTGQLNKHNISQELAEKAGVLGKSEKTATRYYDRFRNRIIFPIWNQKNEIIAFGGRIVHTGEPKYLNSPESSIFQKRNTLYGFNFARKHVIDMDRAIVVEGYLDVIACHQAGIQNVVAPLGTSLTAEQVKLLSRTCNEIVILFDADSAGVKASLRSLSVLDDVNSEARVAQLPETDPFDFIIQRGIRELMVIVDDAVKPVDFKMSRVFADYGMKDQQVVLNGLFEVIEEITSDTERVSYLDEISSKLAIDKSTIRSDFKKFLLKKGSKPAVIESRPKPFKNPEGFLEKSHRELVMLLCQNPELIENAVIDFTESDMKDEAAGNIFKKLVSMNAAGEEIAIDKLYDFFSQGEEKGILHEALEKEFSIERPAEAYTEIYLNINLYRIDKKIQHYADLISDRDNKGGNMLQYMTEIEVLRREREKLSSFIYNKKVL
jgi:DNA primase